MELSLAKEKSRMMALRSAVWEWAARWFSAIRVRRAPRQLRVAESVSLGEKRIVAVIEYQGQKFLVGGGSASVNLLARLGEGADFSEMLTEWCERQR